jgi:hypothetical protein
MSYKSSVNLGLPNIADPPDPAFFAEFTRVYNAIRNLAIALDAYTGVLAADSQFYSTTPLSTTLLVQNLTRVYCIAGAALSYGDIINLYDGGAGVLTARKASAVDATKPAHAWCSTAAGIASGSYGEVMLLGMCTAIAGLTPGQLYYLSNTAGAIATTAGTVSQKVGYGLGASSLMFRPDLA